MSNNCKNVEEVLGVGAIGSSLFGYAEFGVGREDFRKGVSLKGASLA